MDLEKIWKEIIAELRPELSIGNFITVFKPTSLLSLEDNIATIAAPSTMIIDLLQKRFKQTIETALKMHMKSEKDIDVVFIPKVIHKRETTLDQDQGPLFSTYPQPV